jgi:hypothetical protein
MNEIWCFDSSYFGGDQLINWVLKGHSNPRLWVYSFDSDTAGSAAKVLEYTKPLPPEKPHRARTLGAKVGAMVGSAWHAVHATAHDLIVKTTTIDVLIDRGQKPRATDFFLATYGGTAGGHYESIGKYLTSLVNTSRNLT